MVVLLQAEYPAAAQQYAQHYEQQQQQGVWALQSGQGQQASWAAAPQHSPSANGYAQPQPPLPDSSTPELPAVVCIFTTQSMAPKVSSSPAFLYLLTGIT